MSPRPPLPPPVPAPPPSPPASPPRLPHCTRQVLPCYFKHNKLGSFYQQLHTYGFRRAGTAPDAAVEFHHDQYTGSPADFADWIRSGGAVSKRTVPIREPSAAPPPQLLHDMLQVHEGMRQLAYHFHQAKATHAVQLRTILQKLTMRGLLAPESASYISSLPPATPLPGGPLPPNAAAPVGFPGMPCSAPGMASSMNGSMPSALTADLLSMPFPTAMLGNARASHDSLQAQLDALEAGLLAPLSSSAGPMETHGGHGMATSMPDSVRSSIDHTHASMGGYAAREHFMGSIDGTCTANPISSQDLQGDEALSLFADNAPYDNNSHRLPQPYPIGASGNGHIADRSPPSDHAMTVDG